ncbi:MAG: HDOD domain-containing protein [Planctomycetia bacterium]
MGLIDLRTLLARATSLAPLPEVAHKVLLLSREEATSSRDIIDVVRLDPVITARLLKLSNSAVYSRAEHVGSLEEAGATLGVAKLVDLVLTTCASRWFELAPLSAAERRATWERAYASAVAASLLARIHGEASPERAYTAALLADIGRLLLAPELQEASEDLASLAASGAEDDDAERAVLGVDHASLGALVLARYSFPPPLVDAVRHHHRPQAARHDPLLAWCVHLGQQVARNMLDRRDSPQAVREFEEAELAALGLDLASVAGLEELLERDLARAGDSMRLGA